MRKIDWRRILLPRSLKGFLILLSVFLGVFAVCVGIYTLLVIQRIDLRMAQLRGAIPTQFFGSFPPLRLEQSFFKSQLKELLEYEGFGERPAGSDLVEGEFLWERGTGTRSLVILRPSFEGAGLSLPRLTARVSLEEKGNQWIVKGIQNTENGEALDVLEVPPKKIGAYYAGRVRTQNPIALSDMPVSIRHAVMAIEDVKFLDHSGVSFRSSMRAIVQDIIARKYVQGGSTITQQLMKNLFFSREKALKRKIKEALYAFVTEARYSKEDILEAYLNEVYMGQWSTREIHGVSEGALYYFNRDIAKITLGQSATLAAVIQAPNVHDPRKYPDRTLKRRNLVLRRMLEAEFILEDEYQHAIAEPLSVVPPERSLDDVDYFLDLLLARVPDDIKSRFDREPLAVITALNPYLQSAASNALKKNIQRILADNPKLNEYEKKGIHLQSALIAVDVPTCQVIALQGGKSYRQTQFNRVLQGMRQPGSLFKPFVYLAAFDPTYLSPPLSPVTEIEDTPFEWKYDKQLWAPRNYDNKFRQMVLAREALQDSLNVPTARIAQKVGLEAIVTTLKNVGIKSPLSAIPSLSLGSAEVTPIELAQAYTVLAGLGKACALSAYSRVFDANRNLIAESPLPTSEAISAPPAFQTVNVLKGVFSHGTARGALASGIALDNMAGKTGTTNDYKDAWFVGFSPDLLTLVWVGYDEEAKVGLTGAAAALPLWVDFMRKAEPFRFHEDFKIPEGIAPYHIDAKTKGISNIRCPIVETEYFLRGMEPGPCMQH